MWWTGDCRIVAKGVSRMDAIAALWRERRTAHVKTWV